jgi:hypothetical protein
MAGISQQKNSADQDHSHHQEWRDEFHVILVVNLALVRHGGLPSLLLAESTSGRGRGSEHAGTSSDAADLL